MRTEWSIFRRRSLAAVGIAVLLIGACSAQDTEQAKRALAASFGRAVAAIPATVGIAFAPVGTNTVSTLGTWSSGVAWSTAKVPLAIAAQRSGGATTQPLMIKAITQSDNTAAEQLWAELGPPDQAAQQVQAVLRAAGDTTTIVESRRLRPGFTAFGQTEWSLKRQAQFAAHLPCLDDARTVVEMMHRLVDEQRWGLAADGAAAKGGWGPGVAGGYLVRQFGIVSADVGQVGVALAAEPHDGMFDTGVAAVNRMTHWLDVHKSFLPGGSCAR